MTEFGGRYGDDDIAVTSDPETSAETPEHENLNVLRIAAIATLYGDGAAAREVAEPLQELGVPAVLASGARPLDLRRSRLPTPREAAAVHRVDHWVALTQASSAQPANAFLVAALGSPFPRESAAAAAALRRILDARRPVTQVVRVPRGRARRSRRSDHFTARGDYPDSWHAAYWGSQESAAPAEVILEALVALRLESALTSPDSVERSLAEAALIPPPLLPLLSLRRRAAKVAVATTVSTLVHGTNAFIGEWWRPGCGAFHRYIHDTYRDDLFDGGAWFDWSGRYSEKHRRHAGLKFRRWAGDIAPSGLHTVMAHSYGAEVVARAMAAGTHVDELVLLSAPVTRHLLVGAARARRVIDVRLRFDPVLALARAHQTFRRRVRQRMPPAPNVTEVVLRRWTLNHGATHERHVWEAEDVAGRGGIAP